MRYLSSAKTVWLLASLLLVAFLVGPPPTVLADDEAAGAAESGKQPEAQRQLLARAAQYCDALRLRDYATIYYMQSATVTGELTPAKARRVIPKRRFLVCSVDSAEVDENTGLVDLSIEYLMPPMLAQFTDRVRIPWVLINGEWYHETSADLLKD
jgi:hypothetical protein